MTLQQPAALVRAIKPSPTLAVSARATELAASGKDIIDLSVGEPDFDTPEHIKKAAIAALHRGDTKYTAVDGTKALKQAIMRKFAKDNQLEFTAAEVIVSCGAKHSLYNLFAAVLNPGDEIIIPAPYWVSYPDMAKLVGAVPVTISTDHTRRFKMTPAQLQAAMTPKTRLVVLNSPSNPTGVAYSRAELEKLAEVLLKHPNIIVVTDDIYEHTLWEGQEFCNILMSCPALREQTVVVNGVSKAYAMTGWRIGYAAGPAWIVAAMKKIQSQSTSGPCSIAQAASVAALEGDQSCTRVMTDAYHERHDYIVTALKDIPGIEPQRSDGTFYTFPSVQKLLVGDMKDDLALSEYLLNEAGLAVVPGSAFGAPGFLRISYATSMERIRDAVARLAKAVKKLKSG